MSELDLINRNQEARTGVTLFSDFASAVLIGNGFGNRSGEESLLELRGWEHRIIDGTTKELGFNVDPFGMFIVRYTRSFITERLLGWKVVLTQRVLDIISADVPRVFQDMISSIESAADSKETCAADFDRALHPGCATVISGVQKAMNLTEENLRVSYEIYVKHGNSSSATIFSVLHRLLSNGGVWDHVVGCAFGPGISVEMMLFKNNQGSRCGSKGLGGAPMAEDVG